MVDAQQEVQSGQWRSTASSDPKTGEALRPAAGEPSSGGQSGVGPADLTQRVEAALMALDRPLPTARIAEAIGGVSAATVGAAIEQLNEHYQQTARSFRVEQVAGGWQLLTLPEYAAVVAALQRTRQQMRLSPAGLETLAIVAYKQPILRADVEAIRGVACGEVIRTLMDRRLVKIVGRAEELGRPMLYGTTKTFLEVFGLANLKDLPKVEELRPKS